MRRFIVFLLLAAAIFLEIGVFNKYFGQFYITLVIPLVLVMTPSFSLKDMLVAAAATGIVLDSAALSHSVLSTVFLVFEVLAVGFLSK